jgi:hypothetical protein
MQKKDVRFLKNIWCKKVSISNLISTFSIRKGRNLTLRKLMCAFIKVREKIRLMEFIFKYLMELISKNSA